MPGPSETVSIWINSFIPRDVVGYTRMISQGKNSGKTAVPLPGIARLNPLNALKDWEAGYLTDQRTFSPLPSASVRTQSLAIIQLSPPYDLKPSHKSSGTTQVNMKTGDTTGFGVADMSKCSFGRVTEAPGGGFTMAVPQASKASIRSQHAQVLKVFVEGAAGDPLVSAAAIDYEGWFTLRLDSAANRLTVEFEGKIDAFPAFECYALFHGVTKPLFSIPPPRGNTVSDLLGGANRNARGSVSFP